MTSSFESEGIDYGHALAAVKVGHCVARAGWNGKGMCVFMRPADKLPVSFLPKVKSLPDSIKQRLQEQLYGETHYASGEEITVTFNAYLCMLASDGTIVNGWIASQSDALANDWVVLPSPSPMPSDTTILPALAASLGKSLHNLDVALSAARQGCYERLKEFGILATKDGDQVRLDFQGQHVMVANTPEALHPALLALCGPFFTS